jgi:hypothetical protein
MHSKTNYENVHLNVSCEFSKLVQENQVVTLLVVPPKDKIAQMLDPKLNVFIQAKWLRCFGLKFK